LTVGQQIEAQLFGEAADWLVRLQEHADDPELRRHIEHWRGLSPAHAAAWQRAERVLESFRQLPRPLARHTFDGLASQHRRQYTRMLAVLAIGAPLAGLAWHTRPWLDWQADYRTATGERRSLRLADGTLLTLNTASAVRLNFDAKFRRIELLRGEILIASGRDPLRPLRVETAQGSVQPVGTRFSVRQEETASRAAVFEGAVKIRTVEGLSQRLTAGEMTVFARDSIAAPLATRAGESLWEQGMLVATAMPLAAVLAELGRYRHGYLSCSDAVAAMPVSGAFPLTDTDAALDLLIRTRPLALHRVTRFWVRLEAFEKGAQ
jgi:transmembrane sensor